MGLPYYVKIDELKLPEPKKFTDNEKSAIEAQEFPRVVVWTDEYDNYEIT